MREIIFRGKRIDNGKWVYGDLAHFPDKINIDPHEHGQPWRGYAVIPETVGQYTGITDKNGKRIFEGDIISTDIARPYLIVEFRDGCFMFNCNDGGEDYYDIMFPILKEAHSQYEYGEIIGNTHDNPELIKET